MSEFMQPSKKGDNTEVCILGIPLPKSNALAIAVTGVGIFTCYCLTAIAQEYLYSTGYTMSSFLTLITKLTAGVWGLMTVIITAGRSGLSERKCSMSAHALIGFLSFATMWLSNQSLMYLNYPTQSIFKSAKLIPVMLTSIVVLNKRYSMYDYSSAIALFIGLVCFTAGDVDESPNFSFIGVIYIISALGCDAYIGNFQEKMFKMHHATSNEMMIYPNLYAAVFSTIAALFGDEITPAVDFIRQTPSCIQAIAVYSLLNIIGIYFVLASLERFGATTTTFVTSLRKAVTVVISFLLFTKPFSVYYGIGGVLTALGIYLNVYAKQQKTPSASNNADKHVELSGITTVKSNGAHSDMEPLMNGNAAVGVNGNGHNGIDDAVDIDAMMNSDSSTMQKVNASDIQQWLKQADAITNSKQAKD